MPNDPNEGFIPIGSESRLDRFQRSNDRRFGNIETLIYAVVFVALISLVGIVVTVCAMVLDQLHFNNEVYRQYKDDQASRIEEQAKLDSIQQQIQQLRQSPTPTPSQ